MLVVGIFVFRRKVENKVGIRFFWGIVTTEKEKTQIV